MPDYVELHWGKKPPHAHLVNVKCARGPARILGEIRAVSYVTDKGEATDVYRHVFDRHDGRGPYLLEVDDDLTDPEVTLEGDTPELAELGELLDFELEDGERVLVADAMVGTPYDGRDLLVVSETGCVLQIEPRKNAHVVTERGIEH